MLKLIKSKKIIVMLSAILIVALAAGGTYAWFTSRTPENRTSVDMGRLIIDANYDLDDDGSVYYEPDTYTKKTGTVENKGTLPFLAKLDLDMLVTIYSDSEGLPLANNGSYVLNDEDVKGIIAKLDESLLGFGTGADDAFYSWLYNKEDKSEIYLLMDGKMKLPTAFTVYFDGSLGNEFQGAKVDFSKAWFATQIKNGATMEAWGVRWENEYDEEGEVTAEGNLDMFLTPLSSGQGRSAGMSVDEARARITELFNR